MRGKKLGSDAQTDRGWSHRLDLQPGYLSLRNAAAYADVSERTIKRWLAAGLPKYQAGPRSKVLIRPADIEDFLTKRRAPNTDLDAMVQAVMDEIGSKPARKIDCRSG